MRRPRHRHALATTRRDDKNEPNKTSDVKRCLDLKCTSAMKRVQNRTLRTAMRMTLRTVLNCMCSCQPVSSSQSVMRRKRVMGGLAACAPHLSDSGPQLLLTCSTPRFHPRSPGSAPGYPVNIDGGSRAAEVLNEKRRHPANDESERRARTLRRAAASKTNFLCEKTTF